VIRRSILAIQLVVLLALLAGAPLQAQQRMPHVGMLNYAGPGDLRAKQSATLYGHSAIARAAISS